MEKYHAMLVNAERRGSSRSVSGSSAASTRVPSRARPREATQAWLDSHPDAPAALRRLVGENRDPIARALPRRSAMPGTEAAPRPAPPT